ncbi:MAG: CPBP family intramembrane metalloprotease [Deltaproteobacteria bacterium]|nr:CPBP family intramembrane metalloprotease [Deltaproteobacteria bacterium]
MSPAPESPPVESPVVVAQGRPARVWTVFVGFVVALVVLLGLNALVFAAYLVRALQGRATPVSRADLTALLRALPENLPVIILSALGSVVAFAGVALVAGALSKEPLRERLQLRGTPGPWTVYPVVTLGFLAVSETLGSVIHLSGLHRRSSLAQLDRVFRTAGPQGLAVTLLVVGVGAGVAEELFFRGYLQSRLARRWPPWVAIAVTAALFGLVHFDPVHSTFAVSVGCFLGWIAWRARSILPTIAAHIFNNTVATLASASGHEEQSRNENLAAAAVGLALSIAAVVWLHRKLPPSVKPIPTGTARHSVQSP